MMQNRFRHYKEKYELLVNLKVQLFLFFFAMDFQNLPFDCCLKLKKKVTLYCCENIQEGACLVMYATVQWHCAVCLLEALNKCNFILICERFREASETECRHKLEVILAFGAAFGENPQFWIQHHSINITQLSAGKLQVSAERKAITYKSMEVKF